MERMKTILGLALAGVFTFSAAAQDCGPWSVVVTQNFSEQVNILGDISSPRPDLAMSIGYWNGNGVFGKPIVLGWNGTVWSSVELAATTHLGIDPQVRGIGRVPSDDMWVVGTITRSDPVDNLPLVMRRHNNAWDMVSTPALRPQTFFPYGPRGGFAEDVAGVSDNDIWVVGSAAGWGDGTLTSIPMALHWDGATWTDVEVPAVGDRSHTLTAVSASASNNVWAIGMWRDLSNSFKSLIMRWNGTSWQRIANLGEGLGGGTTGAVVAFAPNDVWVSGLFHNASVRLMHWNGTDWDIPSPTIPGMITSFAAIAPNDIWGCDNSHGTFYHYDGVTWTLVGAPSIPESTETLRGYGMDTFGPCAVWSVGAYNDGTTERTLVERLGTPRCDADFNTDGVLDFFDYLDFVTAFAAGQFAADFNDDMAIDFFDYLDFVSGFSLGC